MQLEANSKNSQLFSLQGQYLYFILTCVCELFMCVKNCFLSTRPVNTGMWNSSGHQPEWAWKWTNVKAWANGPAGSRKWTQVELALETCVGRPNGLVSFPTSTNKPKKNILSADYLLFHWLIIGYWTSLNLRWLGLGGQTVKNLLWLAYKLISTRVSASQRKRAQALAIDPRFQLASTCDSVWPGLNA